MRRTGSAVVALKMKLMSQGIQIVSRNWKMKGNGFSPGASRKQHGPANTLILAPVRPMPDC